MGCLPLVRHLHGTGVYHKVKVLGKKSVVLSSYLDLSGALGHSMDKVLLNLLVV